MTSGAVRKNKSYKAFSGRRAVVLCSSAAIALICGVGNSVAQTTSGASVQPANLANASNFDIPAQSLMRALSAFNRQSGIQVTQASGSSTPSVMAKAVRGNMTPQQALAQMLAGTGIDFQFTSNRAVVIGSQQTSSGSPAADGTTVLETIIVSGKTNRRSAGGSGYQGTPDWVYEEPASVSVVSREAIQNNPAMRNAGDALDTVAGVLTNRSESQKPGLSVNVRGLQDMNRVTTSIDGARQNFQRSGHGSYQQVFVDTSFIRSVEVEKGGITGVGGAGALGGMVNFRTIEADDIIQSGKNWGAELKTGSGTNAYNFDGSFVGGVRLSDDFSILGGISSKRIGDYKIGSRGQVQLLGVEGNTVVDDRMLFSRNEALNTLLKTEWQVTDDLKIENSWLRYEADGAQGGNLNGSPRRDDEHYVNNTLTTAIAYDPDTDLIDTKSRFWYNDTKNEETRGYIGGGEPVSYGMKSFGGSLENTSRFTLPVGELSLHYGVEAFHDNGQTKTADLDNPSGPDSHFGFAGTNPSGKRTMASGFTNATLQHEDWLTLTGGLRYDHYKLYGSTLVQNQRIVVTPAQNCLEWQDVDGDGTPDPNGVWFGNDGNIYHSPGPDREFATPSCELWETPASSGTVYDRFPVNVDQSGGAWLPSATIAVKPFEWLQPFISYSKTYRPPAITEALISGGHPFVPFENMPNPSLKPERGETWEFGVNIAQDAILTDEDTFRLKAVYFNRNIEDYISMGQLWFDPAQRTYVTYLNLDGTTRMRGLELEANYDLGHVYLGASYTHIDTDFATSYNAVVPVGFEGGGTQGAKPSVLFVTPKDRFSLDAGVRAFDRRLVVGGRLTYVSNAAPDIGLLSGNYKNDSYTVYDLYGSWAFNDQAKLRFGVSNLTDEKYVPGLGTNSYPAPGRTITASLNMKF